MVNTTFPVGPLGEHSHPPDSGVRIYFNKNPTVKTKIVLKDPNPTWDERFVMYVYTVDRLESTVDLSNRSVVLAMISAMS